jgi:hypothetical protein
MGLKMNGLREDLINQVSAAINWNRMASENAGQGRIRECREKCQWVDKCLRELLQRLRVTADPKPNGGKT